MPILLLLVLLLTAASPAAAIETGVARIIHEDRADGTARYVTAVEPDAGGRLPVATAAVPYDTRLQDGDRVQILRRAASRGAPASVAIVPLAVRRATGAAVVSGTQRAVILLLDYPDAPNPIRTPGALAGTVAAISAYYTAASYGQLTLPIDVVGPFVIAVAATGCDFWNLATRADAAAQAAGLDLRPYQHKVYAQPRTTACAWSGLGTVGGNPSLAWLNGTTAAGVTTHELGHNLGLYHSHSLRRASDPATTALEYGDVADVMGGGTNPLQHFNAAQKARLGWLTPRLVAAGTHALAPLEATPDALRVLRANGTTLTVELRSQLAHAHRPDGVLVHLDAGADAISLLDGTPATGSWEDSALSEGAALVDGALSVRVAVLSPTGATVVVGAGPLVPEPPAAPGGLMLTGGTLPKRRPILRAPPLPGAGGAARPRTAAAPAPQAVPITITATETTPPYRVTQTTVIYSLDVPAPPLAPVLTIGAP